MGLTALYKEVIDKRMFCGMVDDLDFLLIKSINAEIVPNELFQILYFFEETYVSCPYRMILKAEKHHKNV